MIRDRYLVLPDGRLVSTTTGQIAGTLADVLAEAATGQPCRAVLMVNDTRERRFLYREACAADVK